jgi:hypothetical protein
MTWIVTFGGRASDGAETIAPPEGRSESKDEGFAVERFGFYF